jgi:hypothetical protein
VLLVVFALLVVCCGGAGLFAYRVVDRPWPRIDGLADPSGEIDRVASVPPPPGARNADAVTDGTTLYWTADTGTEVTVTAKPLNGQVAASSRASWPTAGCWCCATRSPDPDKVRGHSRCPSAGRRTSIDACC